MIRDEVGSTPYFTGIVYVLILTLGDMLTLWTFLKCQTTCTAIKTIIQEQILALFNK